LQGLCVFFTHNARILQPCRNDDSQTKAPQRGALLHIWDIVRQP